MTDDPNRAKSHFLLMREGSDMDCTVGKRLRATEETSLEWAEQMLDILIRLDDDLQSFDAMVQCRIHSLSLPESLSSEELRNRMPDLEEMAHQVEQGIQHLRNGVRDVMMSMQQQDVIGQSVARAASALEKRAAVMKRGAEELDCKNYPANEIAEIHRAYRAEDDLHRAAGLDEEEYKAAA